MSKNKGKGGKNRRRGKKQGDQEKRELEFKDEDQEYAQVTKMLGNGRLEATCFDGSVRLCHIRGKFRKRVWINAGDIVLLGLREYQDGKADVIHKYSPEEARTLKAYGEIPERVIIGNLVEGEEEEEGNVNFGAGDDSDSDDSKEIEKAAAKAEKAGEEKAEENWADTLKNL